jgi:hypothetical protein
VHGQENSSFLLRNPLRSVSDLPTEAFNRHVLFSNAPVLFSFPFCLAGKTVDDPLL